MTRPELVPPKVHRGPGCSRAPVLIFNPYPGSRTGRRGPMHRAYTVPKAALQKPCGHFQHLVKAAFSTARSAGGKALWQRGKKALLGAAPLFHHRACRRGKAQMHRFVITGKEHALQIPPRLQCFHTGRHMRFCEVPHLYNVGGLSCTGLLARNRRIFSSMRVSEYSLHTGSSFLLIQPLEKRQAPSIPRASRGPLGSF